MAAYGASPPRTPRQRTIQKLGFVFPEIRFENAKFSEVMDFLSVESGVNIIVDPAIYASAGEGTMTGAPPATAKEAFQGAPPTAPAERKAPERPLEEVGGISLRLKNVPLRVVLKYVLRYKNLRYIVDDYAIVIVPIGSTPSEELRTEVFRLRTGSLDTMRPSRGGAERPF